MVLNWRYPKKGYCKATVWERDCYRYTGRGKGGFEMHYNRHQCRRTATHGDYCWQHARKAEQ